MKYEMNCDKCGPVYIEHPMIEDHPDLHSCGSPMRRVFGTVGIKFVGSGFFATDGILQEPDEDDIMDVKLDRRSKGKAE